MGLALRKLIVMEEKKKKLYPMRFVPIDIEHPWGKERIAAADLGVEDSMVAEGWLAENSIGDIMETYLERVVGEGVYGYYGRQFPVAVKFLDIKGEMPVHVHPDDEVAEQRYDALGGKELWYITEAEDDAKIFLGFGNEVSAQELYESCLEGSVRKLMKVIRPKKGDVLVIEPGLVHSASGHLKIAVVKESSELPFRLSSGPEEGTESACGHLAEAMDFIVYRPYAVPEGTNTDNAADDHGKGAGRNDVAARLLESPEFDVSKLVLKDPIHSSSEQETGYILYIGIEGEASFQIPVTGPDGKKGMEEYRLKKGEVMLVPAEVTDFFALPVDRDTVLLEVTAGKRDDTDEYIDPDTEPFLEGEDYEGLEDEEMPVQDNIRAEGLDGSAGTGRRDGGIGGPSGRHNMNWN